jgi:hypothetical protein
MNALTLSTAPRSAPESKGVRLIAACVLTACTAPRLVLSRQDLEHLKQVEVFTDGTSQWVGADGPRFDSIGDLALSGDGLAYSARRGDEVSVVFHERTLGPYEAVEQLTLGPSHLAFAALRAGHWRVVRDDGTESTGFEQVRSLRFSANGAWFAFVGSEAACSRIVVDGVAGPCRERVLSLAVDDAGRAAAVVREDRRERFISQPAAALSDPPADAIAELHLAAGHRAYAARHGERWSAVVDGAASAECGRVRHLRFGDGGRRVAWVCAEHDAASVVIDGVQGPSYTSVSAPMLRDDAPGWAYTARDAQGAWVVAEDVSWGPFAEVTDLALGPRGVTFVTRSNGIATLVHGQQRTELPTVVDGSLALSADGEHWGLITADPKTKTFWLTVDGARVSTVSEEDVFGGAPLGPWVRRAAGGAR